MDNHADSVLSSQRTMPATLAAELLIRSNFAGTSGRQPAASTAYRRAGPLGDYRGGVIEVHPRVARLPMEHSVPEAGDHIRKCGESRPRVQL
jgi:hypothetical protein